MLSAALGGLGVVVLVVLAYDLLSTALATGTAAGPVTSRVGRGWWLFVRRVSRGPESPLAVAAGPMVVVLTLAIWLLLLWLGWYLVFSASSAAVLQADTRAAADLWARAYFTAYAVFTLGVGDYVPAGPAWQVATGIAAVSGLTMTTLAITYLVPVVTAVTTRRTQAHTIASLGPTPADVVISGWDGQSLGYFDQQLRELADGVLLTAERHLSYPVLHFFHSPTTRSDFRLQLYVLDEAVTLMESGVEVAARPHPAALRAVRSAVAEQIEHVAIADEPDDAPPPPALAPLRDAGIPTVDDATFAERLRHLADHRRKLVAFARESLWWDAGGAATVRR